MKGLEPGGRPIGKKERSDRNKDRNGKMERKKGKRENETGDEST